MLQQAVFQEPSASVQIPGPAETHMLAAQGFHASIIRVCALARFEKPEMR
jgi:hypothetical protein